MILIIFSRSRSMGLTNYINSIQKTSQTCYSVKVMIFDDTPAMLAWLYKNKELKLYIFNLFVISSPNLQPNHTYLQP